MNSAARFAPVFLAAALIPAVAVADTTHVIARGHTIDAIARRYHVSKQAIIDANKLTDTRHLKPGDTLVIPGVESKNSKDSKKDSKERERTARHERTERSDRGDRSETDAKRSPAASVSTAASEKASDQGSSSRSRSKYEAKPKHPDVVHILRQGEEVSVHVKDPRGRIPGTALKAFEKVMRSGEATHSVDPRLIALLGIVSNHFGGRPIEFISGFRPYVSTQYTAHSNHSLGRAIDFRVQGVPNEVLRDFCKTLRSAGVGYYPNSSFVHLDVRDAPTYWVDYSHPGEAPKYDAPNPNADEGTTDVPVPEVPTPASEQP